MFLLMRQEEETVSEHTCCDWPQWSKQEKKCPTGVWELHGCDDSVKLNEGEKQVEGTKGRCLQERERKQETRRAERRTGR